eukprot:894339-Lingulodinium_polyedra.AAC.1
MLSDGQFARRLGQWAVRRGRRGPAVEGAIRRCYLGALSHRSAVVLQVAYASGPALRLLCLRACVLHLWFNQRSLLVPLFGKTSGVRSFRDICPMAAFFDEMTAAWDAVASLDTAAVWGKQGLEFVLSHAVSASTHEFATATTMLASMAPLTNGAQIAAFPGFATPLNVVAVMVNYPQSRKSQLTGFAKAVGDALDARARRVASAAYQPQRDGRELPDVPAVAPQLAVSSSVLASFTPEAFFERVSGDYAQIRNWEKMPPPCPSGSVHFGRMANVDEVYGVFASFGLAPDDAKKTAT